MRHAVIGFVCGALFAAGLALSQMTDPARVIGFLDVTGDWDPTLLGVMGGAVGTHALWLWWERRRRAPEALEAAPPGRGPVDWRLGMGSALFGVGWGLSGYCPGPAVAAAGAHREEAVWFCGAMLVGMVLHRLLTRPRRAEASERGLSSGTGLYDSGSRSTADR